jgi:zinc and cadmium transporter
MEQLIQSVIAVLLVSTISILLLLIFNKNLFRSSLKALLIAFATGTILGDVFFHLLPESLEINETVSSASVAILSGIVLMFLIEGYFHCTHDVEEEIEHHKENPHLAKMSIIGDTVHNFLDGIVIASSFLLNPIVGLASTVAIVLHEIPQELSDIAILLYSGMSKKKVIFVNLLSSLSSLLGVLIVFLMVDLIENFEKFALPFAAGQFIYLALSDLMPEIHKKGKFFLYFTKIGVLLIGIIIMYLLTFIE